MRKFDLKYLYSAGAAAALTAAAIAIPAWAGSGGEGGQSQAQRAPLPALPPGAAFFARGEGAGAAEARKHLDELTDCMRENGIDVPHTSTKGGGFSIQVPPPEARSAMEKAAKQCGLPAPPARGHLPPLRPTLSTQGSKSLKGAFHCLGARAKGLPVPVPPPARPSK